MALLTMAVHQIPSVWAAIDLFHLWASYCLAINTSFWGIVFPLVLLWFFLPAEVAMRFGEWMLIEYYLLWYGAIAFGLHRWHVVATYSERVRNHPRSSFHVLSTDPTLDGLHLYQLIRQQ
jgi:hypothetical protein